MKRLKKTAVLYVRLSPVEMKEFDECLGIDAELHDGSGERSMMARSLVRDFCRRTRSIRESEVAMEAAKVMRKRVRS